MPGEVTAYSQSRPGRKFLRPDIISFNENHGHFWLFGNILPIQTRTIERDYSFLKILFKDRRTVPLKLDQVRKKMSNIFEHISSVYMPKGFQNGVRPNPSLIGF